MRDNNFSAEEALIEAARQRLRRDRTTLNESFLGRLAEYAHPRERMQRYDEVMSSLRGGLKVGRKLTRETRNGR